MAQEILDDVTINQPVADLTALAAIPTASLNDGCSCYVESEDAWFHWNTSEWVLQNPTGYDAVVGAGLKYTTLKGALEAGHSKIICLGNITDTADITITGAAGRDIYINFTGNLTFTDCSISLNSVAGSVNTITFHGLRDNTFSFSFTTSGAHSFITNQQAAGLRFINCGIVNNSDATPSDTRFPNTNSNNYLYMQKCSYLAKQATLGGLYVSGSVSKTIACRFDSYDSSTANVVHVRNHASLFDSYFSGPQASSSSTPFLSIEEAYVFSGVMKTNGAVVNYIDINSGYLHGFISLSDQSPSSDGPNHLNISGNSSVVSDFKGNSSRIIMNGSLYCRFTGLTRMGNSSNTMDIDGNYTSFVNCEIDGQVSVSGNHNQINSCKIGFGSGGSAYTITTEVGANANIITSTLTDSAIVDNGTNTQLANNIIF